MNTIITVTTIMSMYMNLTTDVENNKHCYNAEIENGRINAIEVYDKKGEYITASLKRLYTYDEENRLVMRETLKWNKETMSWEKHSCLCYNYDPEGYTIEKRFWNETKHDYAEAKEYSHYMVLMDNVLAVNSYKLDENSGEFALADNMLVMTSDTNKLLVED